MMDYFGNGGVRWMQPSEGGMIRLEAQIYQFELFELLPLLKLDKQLPVEQFEATASQSTVTSPLLNLVFLARLTNAQRVASSRQSAQLPNVAFTRRGKHVMEFEANC